MAPGEARAVWRQRLSEIDARMKACGVRRHIANLAASGETQSSIMETRP